MEKVEADLLHLKCKTENPVEKIITWKTKMRRENIDKKTLLRGWQFCASVIWQGIRLPCKTIISGAATENKKRWTKQNAEKKCISRLSNEWAKICKEQMHVQIFFPSSGWFFEKSRQHFSDKERNLTAQIRFFQTSNTF